MTEEKIKNQEEEEQQEAEEQQENAAAEVSDNNEETEAPAEEEEEKDPLEAAKAEIEQFDNYRKRTLKEKAELILNGGEKAVSAILPIIDDMERAIENGAKTDDIAVVREGMELIYHKMMKALEGLGVKEIETQDADFNTDVHEAVAMVPGMGDDKKGKVIDCLQKGYQLNDKVIRHAKVAVGQ